jgi:hypothetical protein
MKKKFLSATAAVAIMTISGLNVSRSMNEPAMSDVALENVEALAQGEGAKGDPCYKGSYSSGLPLAVKCGTPCTMDHVGGLTDKCS